jgi:hypothetical protein
LAKEGIQTGHVKPEVLQKLLQIQIDPEVEVPMAGVIVQAGK